MAQEQAQPPSKHKHAFIALFLILAGIAVLAGTFLNYSLCGMLTKSAVCTTYRVDVVVGAVLILSSVVLGKMRERKK